MGRGGVDFKIYGFKIHNIAEFARAIGVTPNTVHKWLKPYNGIYRRPTLEQILEISNYFKVSIDEIVKKIINHTNNT